MGVCGVFCLLSSVWNIWMDVQLRSFFNTPFVMIGLHLIFRWLHLRRFLWCYLNDAHFDFSLIRGSWLSGKSAWCYLVEDLSVFFKISTFLAVHVSGCNHLPSLFSSIYVLDFTLGLLHASLSNLWKSHFRRFIFVPIESLINSIIIIVLKLVQHALFAISQ